MATSATVEDAARPRRWVTGRRDHRRQRGPGNSSTGVRIHDLVQNTTFEEVCICSGTARPIAASSRFARAIQSCYDLPKALIESLKRYPKDADPMDVLRTSVSELSFYDPDKQSPVDDRTANLRRAARLQGQIAALVGKWAHIRQGKEPVKADSSLSFAANVYYMLVGTPAAGARERAINAALILHADHELNASTFAARVTAATLADMYAAIVRHRHAVRSAARRRQHGGMGMLLEMAKQKQGPRSLSAGAREQAKGHGLWPPRLQSRGSARDASRRMSEELGRKYKTPQWFEMSRRIEETMKAEKNLLRTSTSTPPRLLRDGIPTDLYTPPSPSAAPQVGGPPAGTVRHNGCSAACRVRGPRDLRLAPSTSVAAPPFVHGVATASASPRENSP